MKKQAEHDLGGIIRWKGFKVLYEILAVANVQL